MKPDKDENYDWSKLPEDLKWAHWTPFPHPPGSFVDAEVKDAPPAVPPGKEESRDE